MRNLTDDFCGYNNTVSALISKMCLEAYDSYDKEMDLIKNERIAMARAIGGTLRKNISIINQSYTMNPVLIEQHLNQDEGYSSHIERATFLKFAEQLYDSGNYRIKKYNNDYEYIFRYELAVFNIGELKKKEAVN